MSTTSVPGTTSTLLEKEFEQLNALVAGYDDSPFDRRMRHWILRSLSPWIRGTSGLELGCLYGEFTKLLVSHFQRLTVVDAAQQFLDITAQTVGQPAGCKLSYKNSLFETLACDEQFDCIFLMHVLEHLMDPVAVLEKAIRRFARPLFMIHGEDDNYIKPEMARSLLKHARGPHSFWLVPGAKHNQALQIGRAHV